MSVENTNPEADEKVIEWAPLSAERVERINQEILDITSGVYAVSQVIEVDSIGGPSHV